jgi:microcompartment protein CcmL/EutN
MQPALGLLEFSSIAAGIQAGDAMVKRAPLLTVHAGTVHPGKYLVLVGGEVASVEEALAAGRLVGGRALLDEVFLPAVDAAVVAAIVGARRARQGEALGVIETASVAATIAAADAAVKGARVRLLEVRLADGLGGKAYALLGGSVTDVEAAVELGTRGLRRAELLVEQVVIPRLHAEMRANLEAHAEFAPRVRAAG